MKRLARLAVCGLMLAASTGCCWHNWGGYGGGACGPCGGCNTGCGYNNGYPGAVYGPTGYAPVAGMTAGVPMVAPTTAYAPLNPLPTY
jgi:hypothetical protein